MNWVKEQNIFQHLLKFPRLNKVRIVKQMKGRPFTAEEFERMLQAVEKTLKPRQHATVTFLLNGLWLFGLRLGEALSLTWDQWEDGIRVDGSGKFVKLMIPLEAEKGGHASVATTEKFYVGIQADETAAMLAGLVEFSKPESATPEQSEGKR